MTDGMQKTLVAVATIHIKVTMPIGDDDDRLDVQRTLMENVNDHVFAACRQSQHVEHVDTHAVSVLDKIEVFEDFDFIEDDIVEGDTGDAANDGGGDLVEPLS